MSAPTIDLNSRVASVPDLNWQVVGDGGYNADGNADILWRHALTGQVYLWNQNGFTTISDGQIAVLSDLNWQVVNAN